jgi:hypothetical protein
VFGTYTFAACMECTCTTCAHVGAHIQNQRIHITYDTLTTVFYMYEIQKQWLKYLAVGMLIKHIPVIQNDISHFVFNIFHA